MKVIYSNRHILHSNTLILIATVFYSTVWIDTFFSFQCVQIQDYERLIFHLFNYICHKFFFVDCFRTYPFLLPKSNLSMILYSNIHDPFSVRMIVCNNFTLYFQPANASPRYVFFLTKYFIFMLPIPTHD